MTFHAVSAPIAIAAALVGLTFGAGAMAHAQSPPATYFGAGLTAGDAIEAFTNGKSCGATVVDAVGEWVIIIGADASCDPAEGDVVTFTLNGQSVEEQETWRLGGSPANLATGLTLTLKDDPPASTPAGPTDGVISGELPVQGFALVKFGGSLDELRDELASKCASGSPVFTTANGSFVPFFPTASLSSPNAAFKALFEAGIPSETVLVGGNCG